MKNEFESYDERNESPTKLDNQYNVASSLEKEQIQSMVEKE